MNVHISGRQHQLNANHRPMVRHMKDGFTFDHFSLGNSLSAVVVFFQVPDLVPIVLVEFDYLVTKDKIEEDENFKDFLNPVVSQTLNSPCIRSKRTCTRRAKYPVGLGNKHVVGFLRSYRYAKRTPAHGRQFSSQHARPNASARSMRTTTTTTGRRILLVVVVPLSILHTDPTDTPY